MSTPRPVHRERALTALIVALAGALLWLWPERLPGLHVDEAWSFFRANEIIAGRRPLDGMNYYTGALHQYLLAAAVALFGLHVWVIHLLSGAANLLMLGAYMLLVRRLHPERNTWLWVGALTASSATFVVYSRLGIELCTLGPLLLVGGALLVQRSAGVARRRASWSLAFAGGALLGLAVYNHMAAAAIVAGLALGYLVAGGAFEPSAARSLAAAAGLVAGLVPRFIQILELPASRKGPGARLLGNLSGRLYDDLADLPGLLRGMLDGDLIYQRVAGGPWLPVVPFFSLALTLLVLLRVWARAWRPARADVGWAVAILTSALFMTLIGDHLALRYYILPALAMPYVLARLASLPAVGASGRPVPGWARRLGPLTLLAVLGLQGLYVGANYFHAHLSSGGKIHVFPLGRHVMEASHGFVRTDRLYARLVELGIPYVVADNLIRWPLELYDIPADHFRSSAQPYDRRWRVPTDGPTALIHYNGPTPMGGLRLEDRRGVGAINHNGRRFTLEPDLDPNFLVFVHRP